MAELRRLLISDNRIKSAVNENNHISLKPQEIHYITRVMRFRTGEHLHVVDGKGRIWLSQFIANGLIRLSSNFYNPLCQEILPKTLVGLAVVIPKQGFDDVLRMSCELGIDVVQPLHSEHGVLNKINEDRFIRWETIINESLEQSERLWKPELRNTIGFTDWLNNHTTKGSIAIAATRISDTVPIESYLWNLSKDIEIVWTLIGPEGGWSRSEIKLALQKGCITVKLGNYILRTSTASIAATHAMMSWRTNSI